MTSSQHQQVLRLRRRNLSCQACDITIKATAVPTHQATHHFTTVINIKILMKAVTHKHTQRSMNIYIYISNIPIDTIYTQWLLYRQ